MAQKFYGNVQVTGSLNLSSASTNAVVTTDGSGNIVQSAVTSTTLGFLDATSSIQTQLGAKLPLAGGTMSGAIAMGSSKITGLASGTVSGDALHFGQIGVANGLVPLDGSSKIPSTYLPSVVMQYEGSWNPTTNSPALVDGTGTNGYVYYVTAAKSAAVSGLTDTSMVNFQVGDLVIYSSSAGKWQLASPAAGVQSVNGSQGAVTVNAINQLTGGDVTTSAASGSQSLAATVAKIAGTTVSGTTGSTNVVFSASPTITGTLTVAGITASGPTALSGNIGFYGTAAIAKPSGSALTALSSLGLITTPTIAASDISSGTLANARGGTGLDTSAAANGALLIGTGSGLALATITQGSGITVTNASGTITIAATGVGSTGDIAETLFSAANNQVSAANVTGLAFANATVRSFRAQVSVYINATTPLYELFELRAIQKASSWDMSISSNGDASNMVFSITTAGQVQYTSASSAGFVANTVKFRAWVTDV